MTYRLRSSWGLLYNTFPDMLLGLDIVPPNVSTMQCEWYRTVSQEFGVPLDNRHGYTKSDWEMWTAATCDAETRGMLVNAVAHWINTTSTGLPMSDLYEVSEVEGGRTVIDDVGRLTNSCIDDRHWRLPRIARVDSVQRTTCCWRTLQSLGAAGGEEDQRGYGERVYLDLSESRIHGPGLAVRCFNRKLIGMAVGLEMQWE